MAVAKLGAIITGLAGSIGGTTFRRSGNGLVVYNRPRNVSLSQVQSNVNLVNIAGLSREYTTISEGQKNAWRSFASLFTFPNRFGDERQISGKSMWMKCNGTLLHFEEFIEIPDGLSIEVPLVTFVVDTIVLADERIRIDVSSLVADARYFVRVDKLSYPGQQIVFSRQKVLAAGFIISTVNINLFDAMTAKFGRISLGQQYAIAVYGVAQVGFPLLMQVQYITIT